jgi:hypothetical protein
VRMCMAIAKFMRRAAGSSLHSHGEERGLSTK